MVEIDNKLIAANRLIWYLLAICDEKNEKAKEIHYEALEKAKEIEIKKRLVKDYEWLGIIMQTIKITKSL